MNASRLAGFLSVLFLSAAAPAQTAADSNEGLRMTMNADDGSAALTWWGVASRTYFILNTTDLVEWSYLPVIEKGAGAPIKYGFAVTGAPPALFFRLLGTDQPAPDPLLADADADGIPNGWELEHALNPFNPADALVVVNGFSNLSLYQQSLGGGADPTTTLVGGLIVYTP